MYLIHNIKEDSPEQLGFVQLASKCNAGEN